MIKPIFTFAIALLFLCSCQKDRSSSGISNSAPNSSSLLSPVLPETPLNYAQQNLPNYLLAGPVANTDNTPANNAISNAGATLGRVLFYDKQMSANATVACASCHQIENGFSDNSFYVNDFLNLYLIWNSGIGFGLLSFDTNLIYNLITILIGLVIIILIMIGIKSEPSEKTIFSIIVGGALGNFYDRIVFNAVPDFIDLHYGNFHWFTFNVADIFITIGVIAFLIKGFFLKN